MFLHWWLQILFARQIYQEFVHHSNKMSMLSTVDDFQVTFACDIYIINHKSKPLVFFFLKLASHFQGQGGRSGSSWGGGRGLRLWHHASLRHLLPPRPGMSLQVPGPPHSALWTHQAGLPSKNSAPWDCLPLVPSSLTSTTQDAQLPFSCWFLPSGFSPPSVLFFPAFGEKRRGRGKPIFFCTLGEIICFSWNEKVQLVSFKKHKLAFCC